MRGYRRIRSVFRCPSPSCSCKPASLSLRPDARPSISRKILPSAQISVRYGSPRRQRNASRSSTLVRYAQLFVRASRDRGSLETYLLYRGNGEVLTHCYRRGRHNQRTARSSFNILRVADIVEMFSSPRPVIYRRFSFVHAVDTLRLCYLLSR